MVVWSLVPCPLCRVPGPLCGVPGPSSVLGRSWSSVRPKHERRGTARTRHGPSTRTQGPRTKSDARRCRSTRPNLKRLQEFDKIGFLSRRQIQLEQPVVVIDHRQEIRRTAVMKIRRDAATVRAAASSGIFRGASGRHTPDPCRPRPDRAGTARSGTGPLSTSVKFGAWWQVAHPASLRKRRSPRLAAARSKLFLGRRPECAGSVDSPAGPAASG